MTDIFGHDGRPLGTVDGGTFRKWGVRKSIHFFRKYGGWGCDTCAVDAALRAGAQWIELTDLESGATYRASLHAMRDRGVPVNHGHGAQLVLPLRYWQTPELQPSLFGNYPAAAGLATT